MHGIKCFIVISSQPMAKNNSRPTPSCITCWSHRPLESPVWWASSGQKLMLYVCYEHVLQLKSCPNILYGDTTDNRTEHCSSAVTRCKVRESFNAFFFSPQCIRRILQPHLPPLHFGRMFLELKSGGYSFKWSQSQGLSPLKVHFLEREKILSFMNKTAYWHGISNDNFAVPQVLAGDHEMRLSHAEYVMDRTSS